MTCITTVNGLIWVADNPDAIIALGFVPYFLSEYDDRPAASQFAENYCGGWDAFKGITKDAQHVLRYPGDPPMAPIAYTKLREEVVTVYDCGWVCVIQPDGSYQVARLD